MPCHQRVLQEKKALPPHAYAISAAAYRYVYLVRAVDTATAVVSGTCLLTWHDHPCPDSPPDIHILCVYLCLYAGA